MNKLSHRLITIASYVKDNSQIIDIGTDHAYLSIFLALTKKNIKIIASDININAYNIAKKNVEKENLTNIISVRLGSGLDVVTPNEIDTIIISGLGSHTIVDILKNGTDKLINVDTLIIQSNTDLYYLRKNITKLNYYIEKEQTIQEKGIYYTVIVFKKGKRTYNNTELTYGPISIKKEDKFFKIKLQEDYEKILNITKSIPPAHLITKIKMSLRIKKIKKILNTLSS